MHEYRNDVGRLQSMMAWLTARVRETAPEATAHFDERADGYFCASWRLGATRELFVRRSASHDKLMTSQRIE